MPGRSLLDLVTGKGNPEDSETPDPLEAARAEEAEAESEYHQAVQERQAREREIKRLRSAAERQTQEHARESLTPGSTDEPPDGVQEIEARIQELRQAEREARVRIPTIPATRSGPFRPPLPAHCGRLRPRVRGR